MNNSGGANAICPYYLAENDRAVICEGVIPGTRARSVFPSRKKMQEHQRANCFQYCAFCEIRKCLDDRYERE